MRRTVELLVAAVSWLDAVLFKGVDDCVGELREEFAFFVVGLTFNPNKNLRQVSDANMCLHRFAVGQEGAGGGEVGELLVHQVRSEV